MRHPLTRRATFLFLLLATAYPKTVAAAPAVDNSNDNLAMDHPSGVVTSTTSPTNYLAVTM